VNDTLLRADPAQLAVGNQVAPCLTPVSSKLLEILANDERGNKGDGGADDLVSTTNGECLCREGELASVFAGLLR
jgi:hypothetical protein